MKLIGSLVVAFICISSTYATLIGPTYPLDGVVWNGDSGSLGGVGGVTRTYTVGDLSKYKDVYWGPSVDGITYTYQGNQSYQSTFFEINTMDNQAYYVGEISFEYWNENTQGWDWRSESALCTLTATTTMEGNPIDNLNGFYLGLPINVWPVTQNQNFTVNFSFTTIAGVPLDDYYNTWNHPEGAQTGLHVNGGLYYEMKSSVPDAVSTLSILNLAFLGLVGMSRFGGARRKVCL